MLLNKSIRRNYIKCKNCMVSAEKGILYREEIEAMELDPWIEIKLKRPSKYIVLSISVLKEYVGDTFTVYFAGEEEGYSQEYVWNPFSIESPGLIRLFLPEKPIDRIRLDVSERSGPTGIDQIVIAGFAKRSSAERFSRKVWGVDKCLDGASIPVSSRSAADRYGSWFHGQRPTDEALIAQSHERFSLEPLISIVVPLYNTDRTHLVDMIQSVRGQSYGKWELVLVNSTPENDEVAEVLSCQSSLDDRIVVTSLDRNFGISGNTNRGIALASGSFIGFLDHDDVIERDLLYEYVRAINENEDVEALYCDEDKLYPHERFDDPRFKPDFNIELLRNNNYVCHLFMVRRDVLDKIGPLPSRFDGAQDHWMILRCSEVAHNIVHVPRVLYHWRLTGSSTAGCSSNKPYALAAGIAAVAEHCDRAGLNVSVIGYERPFTYQVRIEPPTASTLSIVIPFYGSAELLASALRSLRDNLDEWDAEALVLCCSKAAVDAVNAIDVSGALSIKAVCCDLDYAGCVGWVRTNASGDYLVFLPGCCLVSPGWVEALSMYAQLPNVGVVGGRILSCGGGESIWSLPDGVNAGAIMRDMAESRLPSCWFFSPEDTMDVDGLAGTHAMIRRELFDAFSVEDDLPYGAVVRTLCESSLASGLKNVYAADSVLKDSSDGCCRKLGSAPSWRELSAFERRVEKLERSSCLNPNLSALVSGASE